MTVVWIVVIVVILVLACAAGQIQQAWIEHRNRRKYGD